MRRMPYARRRRIWLSTDAATTAYASRGPILLSERATPNACNKCHADRSPEWAASVIELVGGENNKGFQNYGETLYEARNGKPGAGEEMLVEKARMMPVLRP